MLYYIIFHYVLSSCIRRYSHLLTSQMKAPPLLLAALLGLGLATAAGSAWLSARPASAREPLLG